MAGTIYFEGKDRTIEDNIRLADGHRLLILTYPGDKALAVKCIQFESSGLYTNMDCLFHIKDIARFKARLPEFIAKEIF